MFRNGFLIAFLVAATLVSAQEEVVRVSRSSGTAEIEIPGRGWLQAVSGRALPEGGSVATWAEASLDVSGLGVDIELGPLSLLELVSVDVDAGRPVLTILLRAGTVGVRLVSSFSPGSPNSRWRRTARSPTEMASSSS